jgi:hypothetical protein
VRAGERLAVLVYCHGGKTWNLIQNVTIYRKCFDINYKPFGKGLVMASLNINSLLAHIDEFRVFMNESDIDIISINETKLDSSIKDNEVYIPGYEIVRIGEMEEHVN